MKREDILRNIRGCLAFIASRVDLENRQGYTDFNKYAEELFKPIFGYIYHREFKQFKKVNQPALDLYSLDDEIAIQVTSSVSTNKIRHTLDVFLKYDFHKEYKKLYVFFLKTSTIRPTTVQNILAEEKYKYLSNNDIINKDRLLDTDKLYKLIEDCPFKIQQQIHNYLESEFSKTQIFTPDPSIQIPEYNPVENYIERHLHTDGDNSFWSSLFDKSNLYQIAKDKLTNDTPLRIVVKAGAGEGKSIELDNLAYQLQTHQSAFYPLRLSIKNYTGDLMGFISTQFKSWDNLPKSNTILLIDGVDEIIPLHYQTFVLQFNHLLNSEPELSVVYTIRSNFDSKIITGSGKHFETYFIDRLTQGDINQYIENHSEQADQLNKLASAKPWLKSVINVPFYLVEIVELSKGGDHRLPKTLDDFYNKIIQKRLSSDRIKYNGTLDQMEIFNAMKRLGVSMTLQGENTINLSNALKVSQLKEEDIRKTSFLKLIDSGMDSHISFTHNNFQEYLCAKWLSEMEWTDTEEIILNKDREFLNVKLLNTATLLFSILTPHETKHSSLLSVIYNSDYSIIFNFERDRIPLVQRLELFKRFVITGKERKIAYLSGDYTAHTLVEFIENDTEGLNFIVREITECNSTSNHFRSLLYFLYEFSLRKPSYRKKQEIFRIIDGLITKKGFDENEYGEMIRIINLLGFFNVDYLESRIKKCPSIHYNSVLTIIIDLIRKHNIPGQFEFVLQNTNNIFKNAGKSYSSNYKSVFSKYIIENIDIHNYTLLLNELFKVDNSYILFLLDEINIFDNDKIKNIEKIYLKIADLYKTTSDEKILNEFISYLNQINFDSYHENRYGNTTLFFENLNHDNLLEKLLVNEPSLESGFLYNKLFNLYEVDRSQEVIQLHKNRKINDERIISLYCVSYRNTSATTYGLYQYLSQRFPDTIKPYLTEEQTKENEDKRAKRDIELLSDKALFIEKIQEIIDYHKANSTTEISEHDPISIGWEDENHLEKTFECNLPIDFLRWKCKKMPINQIIDYIQDDDIWFKYVAHVILRYRRQGKPFETLDAVKRFLQDVVITKISSINYHMLDGLEFESNDVEILIPLLFKDGIIELPQEKAIEFLFFEQVEEHIHGPDRMADFLIEKYSITVISPHLVEIIQEEKHKSTWLKVMAIEQCNKHGITHVQEDIFELLQNEEFVSRDVCFKYLSAMKFSEERLLHYVTKNATMNNLWQLSLLYYIYEKRTTHEKLKELINNNLVIDPKSDYSNSLFCGVHILGLQLGSLKSMCVLFEYIKDGKHIGNLYYSHFEKVESLASEELLQLSLETLEIYHKQIADHSGNSICGILDSIITNLSSGDTEKFKHTISFYDRLIQDYSQVTPNIIALEWWKLRLTKKYQEKNSTYLSSNEVLALLPD